MNKLVITKNEQAVTTSLSVADSFGKEHKNILRAIRNLIAKSPAIERMFAESTYISKFGREQPMFCITRSGFELLTMGFTGKAATQVKLQYLKEFNSSTEGNFRGKEKQMRKLQLFNFEGQQLRVLNDDCEPWFVSKDITQILEYVNTRATLLNHVSAGNRKIRKIQTAGGKQNVAIMNKAGLFELMRASRKPNVHKLESWIVSEVLPAVKKADSHQAPQTTKEKSAETTDTLKKRVKELEEKVAELEEKAVVDEEQYHKLLQVRRTKVIRTCGNINSNFYAENGSQTVFGELDHDFKDAFEIKKYSCLKAKDFDEAIKFVNEWYPSYNLQREIKRVNSQARPDLF